MKKQTAVEWLAERCGLQALEDVIAEAKEMEKQQIEDAWVHSAKEDIIEPLEDKFYKWEAEQYYNETYGGTQC